MDPYWPVIVILALIASAFSSGMEIAFITSNKLKVELDKKQGVFASKIISYFTGHSKMLIATMLVGNNIALVVYGLYMGDAITAAISSSPMLYSMFSDSAILITQTVISTIIVLVLAEFIPKAIFSINPNRWLNIFAVPLLIWYLVMFVFAWVITLISDGFIRIFSKRQIKPDVIEFGRIDLDHYLEQATGNIDHSKDIDHEIQIFQNALDFASVKARDCMVPRNEIVALEITDEVEALRQRFIETRLSKILIYKESIDHIIGYVHSFELFKKPAYIQQVLRPLLIVPEPMTANEILEKFIKQKKNMAVVVDEFGGTAGIITMEDIVEEIFGEIEDEHDKEENIEKQISDSEFEFSARIEIDYINEKYGLDLPADDQEYDTLSGLLLHLVGDIPEEGQKVEHQGIRFTSLKVSENKIDLVRIEKLD